MAMTEKVNLNTFRDWVTEKEGRSVKIELGDIGDCNFENIWVYDYGLKVGQYVVSVEEIDLDALYEKSLKEQIESASEKLKQLREKA